MKSPVRAKNAMGMSVHQMCYLALFLAVVAVVLGGLGTKAYFDIAHNDDEDQQVGNLRVNGVLEEYKRKVIDVTGTAVTVKKDDSGALYTLNVAANAATTITLPSIASSDDVGLTYTFVVVTENTGGYSINTADGNDTTGDIYVGGIGVLLNATTPTGRLFTPAVDNDAKIFLSGTDADGGGEVGSIIRVTAVKYSSSAHSHWMVEGIVGTDDADGTGLEILQDL